MNYQQIQLETQVQAAKKTGIYDSMFLAFGSLLGYVREKGIIKHDTDMDVGFLSDKCDPESIENYCNMVRDYRFVHGRMHKVGSSSVVENIRLIKPTRFIQGRNPSTNEIYWTSIRLWDQSKVRKCCHWFMFPFKGYYWHTKGPQSKVKGINTRYLEIGKEVDFLGVKIHIPKYVGSALDWWYPDWNVSRPKCDKSYSVYLNIKNWGDNKKWYMK